MVDVPEYKYGKISLVVAIISGFLVWLLKFQDNGLFMPITLIALLAAIAYFVYGYKRVNNVAKPMDYAVANYFIPNKIRIYAGLIVTCVFFIMSIVYYGILSSPLSGYSLFRMILNSFEQIFYTTFTLTYFAYPFLESMWKKPFSKLLKSLVIFILLILLWFIIKSAPPL